MQAKKPLDVLVNHWYGKTVCAINREDDQMKQANGHGAYRATIQEEPCETCGGQRQIDVSAPNPEAPAQWCTCPECQHAC